MERQAKGWLVVLEIAAAYPMVGSFAQLGWSYEGMTQRIGIMGVPEAAIRGMS